MEDKISVVIITLNEERIIEKCLSKLSFADEIIVVDSGSQDGTVALCKKFGAQVFYNKFEGYGMQKRFAVAKTRNNWVLSLDADEILNDELIVAITRAINHNRGDIVAYYIKGQHIFLNRKFKYGSQSNRYYLRMFNKTKGNFNSNTVHESIIVDGKKDKLKGSFLHYSYESLEDYFTKFNRYTSLYAKGKADKNKKYSFIQILLKSKFEFFKIYIIDRNFMNGIEGFYWALFSALYVTVKSVKTNELSMIK
jgi:glycosyltransferase involved in cell wall biosynthesis